MAVESLAVDSLAEESLAEESTGSGCAAPEGAPDESVAAMLAFAAGDEAAFEALFRRWAGPLLGYLHRMVHDMATAEELVQDTFLRVHQARERYVPSARFSTWLYRIATRLALNELRRPRSRQRHESVETEELRSERMASDELVDLQRRADTAAAQLAALPERQRAALWLVAVEGLSYAEVADALETTSSSVKALVHRARSAIAQSAATSKLPRLQHPRRLQGDRT